MSSYSLISEQTTECTRDSYPFIYTVTTLPIAAARFSIFHGNGDVPFGVTVFADVLFSLSGFFNVLLFWFTRRSLLPRRDEEEARAPQQTVNTITISLQSRESHSETRNPIHPEIAEPADIDYAAPRNELTAYNVWGKSQRLISEKNTNDSSSISNSMNH